jgi:dienelactone hydrolase
MAVVVLAVAAVVQGGFALLCIATRSRQARTRSFIRIGAWAAFVAAALGSAVRWGFRWYGLAVLLSVWAALGVWSLARGKAESDHFSVLVTVRRGVTALLLVALAMLPAVIFPQYTPPRVTGSHQVATARFTYTDESRIETFSSSGEHREVNVEFWYPSDAVGRFPLVVFSHGALGLKVSNTSTFLELASNGYVVCSIDHPYDSVFTIDADGHLVTFDRTYLQQVVDVNNGVYSEADTLRLEKEWLQRRTDDIDFVLDTVVAKASGSSSEPVYQLIDPGKIGLMGHSLGGASSAEVARERDDVGAVVDLDADLMGDYLGYSNGKYELNDNVYPVPLLAILADDVVRLIAAVPNADATVAVQHVMQTAPNAYEVHIEGTDHQSLTDLPLVSPFFVFVITRTVKKAGGGETADKRQVIERMNDLVLRFFNAYLKGQGTFSAG